MEHALRVAPDREQASDWALALSAEGIPSRIAGNGAGYIVFVADHAAERAEAVLCVYERENEDRHARVMAPPVVAYAGRAPQRVALAVVAAMGAFYWLTGPRDPQVLWFQRGSADAARILAGELWRSVTALSLHADLAHLVGNTLTGGFFLAALGRSQGPGLALALALLAGTGGNLVNAALRSTAHVSVGASTAVFGAVGVLSGWGALRRRERGEAWQRVVLPVAAALGVLAMLGVAGERVDLWAHLFGLAVGVALGVLAARLLRQPPGLAAQWLLGTGAVAAMALCWRLALA